MNWTVVVGNKEVLLFVSYDNRPIQSSFDKLEIFPLTLRCAVDGIVGQVQTLLTTRDIDGFPLLARAAECGDMATFDTVLATVRSTLSDEKVLSRFSV